MAHRPLPRAHPADRRLARALAGAALTSQSSREPQPLARLPAVRLRMGGLRSPVFAFTASCEPSDLLERASRVIVPAASTRYKRAATRPPLRAYPQAGTC